MTLKVLVTGGLGYVGGRLARHLAANGYALRLTRRPGGRALPDWAKSFEIAEADFAAEALPANLCDGIDAVVHLAALNAPQCAADPERAIAVNIAGTERLLRQAADAGVKRFLYLSTAHVYAAPLAGTIDEDMVPRPAHPYGWTHRAAEDIVLAAKGPSGGMEGIALRMTNAVGAPADAGADCWMLVANDLCRQVVAEGAITLSGSGEPRRDFIAMADVTAALTHMLQLPTQKLGRRLFNLGGGETLRIIDLAERIADGAERRFGKRPEIRRRPSDGPAPALDFRIHRLAASGFTPTGDLAREIDQTLALCQDAFGPQGR
jgi:UDP-glucose 4-epimerase